MKTIHYLCPLLSFFALMLSPVSKGFEADPVTKANANRFWGIAEEQLPAKYDYERKIQEKHSTPVSLADQVSRCRHGQSSSCDTRRPDVYISRVQSPAGGPRIDNEESNQVKNARRTLGFNILGDFNLFNIRLTDETEDSKSSIKGKL